MSMTVLVNKRRTPRTPVACAAYYSDGAFHASGMTENLTDSGGCLRGTEAVKVGMELTVLLIPPAHKALLVKKATVRWVKDSMFGVELNEQDCGAVGELGEDRFEQHEGPLSFMTH
jgi:hypothetical protein